jgi:hypothetical protein
MAKEVALAVVSTIVISVFIFFIAYGVFCVLRTRWREALDNKLPSYTARSHPTNPTPSPLEEIYAPILGFKEN